MTGTFGIAAGAKAGANKNVVFGLSIALSPFFKLSLLFSSASHLVAAASDPAGHGSDGHVTEAFTGIDASHRFLDQTFALDDIDTTAAQNFFGVGARAIDQESAAIAQNLGQFLPSCP